MSSTSARELAGAHPGSRTRTSITFAVSRLTDLRKLLARPESVNEARALLSEQVGRISLWPVAEERQWHYEAKGSVDFFGEEALRVGGAGGLVSIVSPILPIRAEVAVAA